MKKTLATFLVVVLAVGLVACGVGESGNKLTYDLYSEIELSEGFKAAKDKIDIKPELSEELSDKKTDVWVFREEVEEGEVNNIILTVEKDGDKLLGKSTNLSEKE